MGKLHFASTFLLAALWGSVARAEDGDLSDALRFASGILGEEVTNGLEDFIDDDPDEALSLLLARDVVPGRTPEAYDQDDELMAQSRGHVLTTLGSTRLGYAEVKGFILEASKETGIPAGFIDAVIRTESGYRPRAVSRAGAQGLMQLLPETSRLVGVADPFDPRQNILGGARYLKKLVDLFGSLRLAAAAYNAGPAAVQKYGKVPPFLETTRYVDIVLSRYQSSRFLRAE